jgi:hypothetical protein
LEYISGKKAQRLARDFMIRIIPGVRRSAGTEHNTQDMLTRPL